MLCLTGKLLSCVKELKVTNRDNLYCRYEHATVCFVFLPDVDHMSSDQEDTRQDPKGLGARFSKQQFLDSKWFTRGWTLQELLAPSRVLFFNKTFEAIGEKVQYNRYTPFHMLNNLISEAAGISIYAQGEGEHEFTCIAQKMCWASRRVTTREEDVAYCLLGLFKVNMPLLYGEGSSKAFLRLQLEILASSNDDSIFAWDVSTDASLPNQERPWSGLLAPSPRNFANCSEIRRIDSWSLNSHWTKKATYTITHRGIEMSMPRLIRSNLGKSPIEQVLYPLMCESGRYQKLYLKLWIENPERGGSPYADGARVAWRSGCVVSPTAVPYNRRAFRSANRLHLQMQLEFCGLSEPKLIRLTDVEDRFGLQWGSATHSFRDWGKTYWMYLVGAEFLALSKAAGEKLCFTTTWEEFESPDWKFRHTEL